MFKKLTTEEFIEKAIKIHKNNYDYSKVNYINNKIKVIIYCKKCNKYFNQIPNSHLTGQGCSKCAGHQKTTEDLIIQFKKIHKNNYDYSKVKYIKSKIKVIIICKKCDKEFKQTPASHLGGNGCPKCGFERTAMAKTLTTNQFIEKAIKIHKNNYDYSKVNYINCKIKVTIYCKKCNKYFNQSPGSHLHGVNCPFCKNKNENKVRELLIKHLLNFKIYSNKLIYKYIGVDKKEHKRYCDFWLEKDGIKFMVEYDGRQHQMPVNFNGMSQKQAERRLVIQQYIDKKDAEFCNSNNILLWRVQYNENKEDSIRRLQKIIC